MIDWFHPAFTSFLTVVHAALALGVTVHVLLKKREVGSAMAWMGVAWLSPGIGVLLYVLFGINRVHRKAFRIRQRRQLPHAHVHRLTDALPRSDHLAPLEHAVDGLTRRVLPAGNKVEFLRDGEEAYPAMLAAIEKAAVSIALTSYIFDVDAAGQSFIDALAAARRRGVEIRVIVDGVGSGYLRSPAFQRLRAQGITVARFMHSFLPWHMTFLNMRSHKKILVVDGTIAFLGGINISTDHLPSQSPQNPIRDVHFRVTGPVVTQIAEVFAADWFFTTAEELKGKAWFPPVEPAGDAAARIITSGPDRDRDCLSLTFQQAIGCARRSIKLVTPYFLPEDRLTAALVLATMRGVRIDIVIPTQSDNILVDWATRAHVAPLLEAGCHIWLAPKPFEHSKLMTVDGEWSLIGSANWDVRSMRLNFEVSLEIYSNDFASLIEQQIERRKGQGLTLMQLNRRPLPIQLRDSAARLLLPYL